MKRKSKRSQEERGCVYFSHLPHGFYEEELKAYLSQFGHVTGVYVPRSKVTNRARGYAFVEFRFPEVALVVADTMNNYLMFNKLVKAEVVPPEKQRPTMFSSKYKRVLNTQKVFVKKVDAANADEEKYMKNAKKSLIRQEKKLKALGLDFKIQIDSPLSGAEDLNRVSASIKKEKPKNVRPNPNLKSKKPKSLTSDSKKKTNVTISRKKQTKRVETLKKDRKKTVKK